MFPMAFRGWFERLGQKREEQQSMQSVSSSSAQDGWVELVGGRVVVHDPAGEGRFPTLAPDPGIHLWINGEPVDEPMVVTAADEIRYEVAPDADHFMDLTISEDEMTVTLTLTADPERLPDTVALVGRTQARLQPACSPKARHRTLSPKQVVLDRLRDLGVVFGIDEAAIDAALKGEVGASTVIARGQEAQAPVPGQWVWRLGEWSLVEAGQVVAAHQGGKPNLPRITVRGKETKVYEDCEGDQAYLAGEGTRMLGGGRLVASVSGRARAVPTADGMRVSIFPVKLIDGDLTTSLETDADLIVEGNVRGATVRSAGEVIITGHIAESEICGAAITVRGEVADSKLYTMEKGHYLPLKPDLAWIQRSLEAVRDVVARHGALKEETFREIQHRVRSFRRRADEIGINHPDYQAVSDELAQLFLGAHGAEGLDRVTLGRLLDRLSAMLAVTPGGGSGAVSARVLTHTTVWAAGDIQVAERVANSLLYSGGSIRTPEQATLTQSELVAAEDVALGTLASVRGSAPVVVRAGGRMLIDQIQAGCVLEYGIDRREFKSEMVRIVAGGNSRGQLVVRQLD